MLEMLLPTPKDVRLLGLTVFNLGQAPFSSASELLLCSAGAATDAG